MSLTLVKEPSGKEHKTVDELSLGTWFIDTAGQIYVIALDDRTDEKRVLCAGNFYKPFIVNVPLAEFEILKILEVGTVLEISETSNYGGGYE